jgi:hypothetical protein
LVPGDVKGFFGIFSAARTAAELAAGPVYREFGPAADPGVVFFLGQGLLEVSGRGPAPCGDAVVIWLQVREVRAEHRRLAAAGARVLREPAEEPWGLTEMWIEDPAASGSSLSKSPRATRCAAIRASRATQADATWFTPVIPRLGPTAGDGM